MTDLRKAAEEAAKVLANALSIDFNDKRDWYSYKHDVKYATNLLLQALAQPEQSQTSGYAKKIESLIKERDELRQALAQPEQEPVHFLANGVRYKVTHQGYYGCSIVGLPENLNGQWVALVEATDSKHLNCIAHQESTKPEQQPVAYLCENAVGHKYFRWKKPTSHYKPIALYTTPPSKPWQSLTDDDRIEIFNSMDGGIYGFLKTWGWLNFSKALEAKLKEKNT